MKQLTFAGATYEAKKKRTRREKFLAEMEQVVPWSDLCAVVEPFYPKSGRRGRPPMPLLAMLRIYCLQQWYALSDPAMEDAIPDETTILKFRRLLERHGLTSKMMNRITDRLERRGLLGKGDAWKRGRYPFLLGRSIGRYRNTLPAILSSVPINLSVPQGRPL